MYQMSELTPEGRRIVEDAARNHSVGTDAVRTILEALMKTGGGMAQFSHPELGGMGQWSRGGMIMIGDMFNNNLKYRVDALCNDLARAVERGDRMFTTPVGHFGGSPWWPQELGVPSSSGAQNDMRYACFPDSRRLAVDMGGNIWTYDTGEHRITGFAQQQGNDRTLTFTSQFGTVRLDSLRPFPDDSKKMEQANDVFGTIAQLADLRDKGVLTEDEFATKKAELLKRI
jgi:hypothetical protein